MATQRNSLINNILPSFVTEIDIKEIESIGVRRFGLLFLDLLD